MMALFSSIFSSKKPMVRGEPRILSMVGPSFVVSYEGGRSRPPHTSDWDLIFLEMPWFLMNSFSKSKKSWIRWSWDSLSLHFTEGLTRGPWPSLPAKTYLVGYDLSDQRLALLSSGLWWVLPSYPSPSSIHITTNKQIHRGTRVGRKAKWMTYNIHEIVLFTDAVDSGAAGILGRGLLVVFLHVLLLFCWRIVLLRRIGVVISFHSISDRDHNGNAEEYTR